ncbi:MAG: hypothetical protein ACT4QC_04605 [Planctomycetaceae bacterium]
MIPPPIVSHEMHDQNLDTGNRLWPRFLLILSGLVLLLGLFSRPMDTTPLVYTVFVAAVWCRPALERSSRRFPGRAGCIVGAVSDFGGDC